MTEITDDMVFRAQEAAEIEMRAWTIIERAGGGPVIAHDMKGRQSVGGSGPFAGLPPVGDVSEESYERLDFSDSKEANSYIKWRAWKAGLAAAIGGK